MNAPLPSVAVSASMAEIAKAMGITKQAVSSKAIKESWPFEKIAVRGAQLRLFPLDTLPADVASAVKHRRHVVVTVNKGSRLKALTEILARFEVEEEAATSRRQETAEAQLKDLAGGLSDGPSRSP